MEVPLLWFWFTTEEWGWSVCHLFYAFEKKGKKPQTNSFPVSNTEPELWNPCFRYKQWSLYKTMERNKFYFLPTDGNQQMLKSSTVIDKHVDLHSYVLITSSLGKLRRKGKLNYFRGFSCYLSGKSQWGIIDDASSSQKAAVKTNIKHQKFPSKLTVLWSHNREALTARSHFCF